jgi:hypothetical protein
VQDPVDIDKLLNEAALQTPEPSHDLMDRVMGDARMVQAEFVHMRIKTPSLWERVKAVTVGMGERMMRPAFAVPGGVMATGVLALVMSGAPMGDKADVTDVVGQVAVASQINTGEGILNVAQSRSKLLADLDEELFPLNEITADLITLEEIMADIIVDAG